jgi:hypothetical protein
MKRASRSFASSFGVVPDAISAWNPERDDRADLHERREVVARREQQPDRQHGRREAVQDHHQRERRAVVVEPAAQRRACVDPASAEHGEQQQRDPDRRALEHSAGPDVAHEQPDQDRDRDGRGHRRRRPRAIAHRVHDDEAEHRDQDDHDRHYPDQRDGAADDAELVASHLAERAAVTPDRAEQRDEILHAAAERRADEDPERAGQVAELRGKGGPDQWARARDRGEVVAEHDPAIRRDEVAAVAETLGGCRARGVEREHLGREKRAVEPVAERVHAHGRDDEPHPVHRLASVQRDAAERGRAQDRDADPDRDADRTRYTAHLFVRHYGATPERFVTADHRKANRGRRVFAP